MRLLARIFNKSFLTVNIPTRSLRKNRFHLSSILTKKGAMPPIDPNMAPSALVDKLIAENKVMLFSKSFCPFCFKVKDLLNYERIGYNAIEIDKLDNGQEIQNALIDKSGQKTVPNVFINGKHVGGSDDIHKLAKNEELFAKLTEKTHDFEYDFVIIGGGSGGLAASKEAARYGAKVAVCDFVTPTPTGTTWGLGGTCVNVGCIPKKLMHQAAIHSHNLKDAADYGWETPESVSHNWGKMVEGIQNHIGSLNWGYKVALRDKKVTYLNAFAKFVDTHTLKTVDRRGREKTVTADKFLIAVGGRPRYPDIPGAKECGITSDDVFSLPHAPGKTLLIGASYISLECAGFLAGLGYDVTVMVRSIFLRGFDQQMANLAADYMGRHGVKFIKGAVPTALEKVEEGAPGKVKVIAKTTAGEEISDVYNTVIFAIGRDPCTKDIGLDSVGVQLDKNGKIIADKNEKSSVDNIFAVGDVMHGGLELTPVAIQAGKLLARRLYGNRSDVTDYDNVPTTVFTPLEYGCCGLSEEVAIEKFGENNIEVYHSSLFPLEFTVAHRPENDCYVKLICHKYYDEEKLVEKVIGFHYLGPNAGEVTQGFAIGLKMGATKEDFNSLIGIHPTCAEVFTTLNVTKRSGKDVSAQGC